MDSQETPVRVKSGGTKVSRRTVARGAAWSAPIAAVAYAAPAFAASCIPQITLNVGESCKCPGQSEKAQPWIYYLSFCITDANSCGISSGASFTVTSVKSNPQTPLGDGHDTCFPLQLPITGTVGGGCTNVVRLTSTNSANGLDVTFTVGGQTFTTTGIPAPPDCTDINQARRCEAC